MTSVRAPKQTSNIDINTVRDLGGEVVDLDNNGLLSEGDLVNKVRVEKWDLLSNENKSEYLSQTLDRRIDLIEVHWQETFLFASESDDSKKLALVYRVAKWGYCTHQYGPEAGKDYDCIGDERYDAALDPNFDLSTPYQDNTRDLLFYSANAYSDKDEQRFKKAMAKITDPAQLAQKNKYLDGTYNFLTESLFDMSTPPAKWTHEDDVAFVVGAYKRRYQRIAAKWEAHETLTGNELNGLQGCYQTLQKVTARKSAFQTR